MEERFYNIYNGNDQLEIKKYGEVYTPKYIVENMINKIPEEVWNNKNLKVLDFACGCGIFGYFVYKKLVQYFDHDYIVNNILYFNDIQEKNINKVKYIFNNPRNIYHCNFLEWNCDLKFDVIIGNPPYSNLKGNRSNGNAIWYKFVDKILLYLNKNGYLSLIHPPGWRKPSDKKCKYTHLYKELTQNRQMHYLEIYDTKDGKNIFNCGTRFDIYLVQNIKPYKNTIIIDENCEKHIIDLLEWNFLPNHSYKLMYKLLKCNGNKIDIIHVSQYSTTKKCIKSTKDELCKYPLIHSITKNGIRYKYSPRNDLGCFGVSKIIWCKSNYFNNIIDIEGKYGLTELAVAIKINSIEQGELISKCFKTSKFKTFMNSIKYGNYDYDFKIFKYLNDGIWDEFLKDD